MSSPFISHRITHLGAGLALALTTGLGTTASCADLSGDCKRLGTCAPSGSAGGHDTGGGGAGGGAPLGASCDEGIVCASGFCADGVCCDGVCDGECSACNLPGTEGTCAPTVGASCGAGGQCDGGARCATGALAFAFATGSPSGDLAGQGAILPNGGAVVTGSAAGVVTTAGLSTQATMTARGFAGALDAEGNGTDILLLGEDDAPQGIDRALALADGGVIYGGTFFGTLALPGLGNWLNTGPADGFLVAFNDSGTPRWRHRIQSPSMEDAVIEALAANEEVVVVAVRGGELNNPRRTVQVLSTDNGAQLGAVGLSLGADVATGGRVAGLDLGPGGQLWVLAEYRDSGTVEQATMPDLPLASPGSASGASLTRTVLIGYDVATLNLVAGPFPFGSGFDVRAGGLAVRDDTIYIAGGFGSSLAPGSLTVDGVGDDVSLAADDVGTDPFILALNPEAKARWGVAWASTSLDARLQGLAVESTGDIAFVGNVSGGEVIFDGVSVASTSEPAAFVGKLGAGGQSLLWLNPVNDPSSESTLNWVGFASDGKVWITGSSAGSVLGASPLGDIDVFIAAFEP